MFVPHNSVHLPMFQQLAHRMMSRLARTQTAPVLKPCKAQAHNAEVALEEWDLLFGAVTERLKQSMDTLQAATADVPGTGPATAAARISGLECVEALTQLRTTMRDTIDVKRP